VVTPSFQQGRFIRRNIESVLEQGEADWEHIVADGGSTDETVEILKSHPHLRWVSEKDGGQSEALNKGIRMARGRWIVWINSDDHLLPGCFDALRGFLADNPRAEFIYSNLLFVDAEGREMARHRAHYSAQGQSLYYWWRGGVGFPQPGSFFTRELWEKHGPFDESLHYAMDYDFWLKISQSVEFLWLDAWLAAYRLHGESKTLEGWRPFLNEQIAITRRYWDSRGGWAKWKFRWLCPLVYAKKAVLEGIRAMDAGFPGDGRRLWREALGRQPLAFVLSRPFLSYAVQKTLRVPLWNRLKSRMEAAAADQ
jgi:glycosyltransferase involved in cell wall biosynthesis